MKRLKLSIAAMSLMATLLLTNSAMAVPPSLTFYTAGSSAQFPTFVLAMGTTIYSGGPLCGTHHWTKKNTVTAGVNAIAIHDPRSTSIQDEPGNIAVVWNDAAAAGTGGTICFYVTVDSTIGVRLYQASATLTLAASLNGSADQNFVPLLGTGEALNGNVFASINGAKLNAANTDIRPEDAKFATMRALTAYGTQVTGRNATGLGYGPFPIGTAVKSSVNGDVFYPVDFAIDQGDTDPVNAAVAVRRYVENGFGAAPVLVVRNVSSTLAGHLGDPNANYNNVNRFTLANVLMGNTSHAQDIAASGTVAGNPPTNSYGDIPIHVYIREPLSGTYNTIEWTIPNSREIGGEIAFNSYPGQVWGQDRNITLAAGPCTVFPCTVESGNPLHHNFANGGTRDRVIGSGQMIATVNSTADSIGYSFWGFGSFDSKPNLRYLTVEGADPLYSGPSANPGGVGVLPQCTKNGSGVVTSCPQLTFPNIVNGAYPIWSKYRMIYDSSDSTSIATTVVNYAIEAANVGGSNPGSGLLTDFVPSTKLQVFRSHYAQVIRDSGIGTTGNNGIKTNVPETGGDMGGAVLTVQSELDFISDTGGNQQIDLKQ